MRKLILVAALALVVPATAAAAPKEPTPADLARAACKTEKHSMGTQLFKTTYNAKSTSKAMAACIAKAEPAAEAETKNAAKACKAERAANRAAFTAKYGGKASSAFGKCVSSKSKKK